MKNVLLFFGHPIAEVSKATGISVSAIWRHLKGQRVISPIDALTYEKKLGIPLWKTRPDLWEAPAEAKKND